VAAPALAIRRFALAVEGAPARVEAAARLAESAVRDFLREALDGRLPETEGDSLLMLRRLELDLKLDEADDARRIADRLAVAIAAAVGCALLPTAEGGPDGEEGEGDALPRFASANARTAAFLAALVEGRDRSAWWFRSFDGVRLLSVSAAARTVLLRDPGTMPAVFACLDPAVGSRFAASLNPADAGLLLDALAALPSPPVTQSGWHALAVTLRRAAARAPLPRALEALILLATASASPGLTGEVARAASAAAPLVGRDREKRQRPAGKAAAIPQALRAALRETERTAARGSTEAPLFSPLGGYSLLLSGLLELDLDGLVAGWPRPRGIAPEAALRLLILTAAAGDRRLLDDPFWRQLLGLPARLPALTLRDWLAELPPSRGAGPFPQAPGPGVALPRGLGGRGARRMIAGLARRVLGRFAGRLPGFASASPVFLRTNLLGAGASLSERDGVAVVRLERPPLDVLLSITGAGECRLALPDGRIVQLERRR
jgi:hypothetical protein